MQYSCHFHHLYHKGTLSVRQVVARTDMYHGVGPFDPVTGNLGPAKESFSDSFGKALCDMAEKDGRVAAITAAMCGGTGLSLFEEKFPERLFDIGIAEGHAVAMAAGMAKQGAIPVFAVYSSFLQRAYDMLIHDVALQDLHVVFCVDRAGLVGSDGETHHGVFDVVYLDSVPGMTVLAPASFAELEHMLERAVLHMNGPVAVRYPRGSEGTYTSDGGDEPAVVLRRGKDITLAGYGTEINDLLEAAGLLAKSGVETQVVKLNQIAPLVPDLVVASVKQTGALLVAEDCIAEGCVGQRLAAALEAADVPGKVCLINCGGRFVTHGALRCLKQELGLDGEGIARKALEVLGRG